MLGLRQEKDVELLSKLKLDLAYAENISDHGYVYIVSRRGEAHL
jgi:hypothetical protein